MSDISDASRATEIRRALDRLRDDLDAAGIDLTDPRARQLVISFIGSTAGDRAGDQMGAAAKRALALDMRAGGSSYREIARALGWKTHVSAMKAVKKALEGVTQTLEQAEEVRSLELERLDQMWKGLAPQATKGNPRAVMAAVRLMGERRHLVAGLDVLAPVDAMAAGNGVINVFMNIPEGRDVTPEPEGYTDAIDVASHELPPA